MTKWFLNTFLPSFKEGDTQITEKQYNVFVSNLKGKEFIDGYISGYMKTVNGYKLKVYSWQTVNGTRYYIEKEKAQQGRGLRPLQKGDNMRKTSKDISDIIEKLEKHERLLDEIDNEFMILSDKIVEGTITKEEKERFRVYNHLRSMI